MKVTPDGKTAFVTRGGSSPGSVYFGSDSVSTIDVKTRKKYPTDIPVGSAPFGVAFTPDGKTAFVTNNGSGTVSTIDVKTRKKHPTDIPVGANPKGVALTPDGKTAFVTNANLIVEPTQSNSVSTIDVTTKKKHPHDITVGVHRVGVVEDGRGDRAPHSLNPCQPRMKTNPVQGREMVACRTKREGATKSVRIVRTWSHLGLRPR